MRSYQFQFFGILNSQKLLNKTGYFFLKSKTDLILSHFQYQLVENKIS